ncbi:S1/P1 nuclease [Cellvibrio sp. BR]|nr:S1/P1 nuclease [Cellvibrio sp. BR]
MLSRAHGNLDDRPTHLLLTLFELLEFVMKIARFVCGLLLVTTSVQALAWGQNGHRIVGQIANEHLTKKTQQALLPLLGGDLLAEVGTWADEMRSDPAEFWQKDSTRWHYINVAAPKDFDASHYHTPQTKEEVKDIYGGILRCIAALKDKNTPLAERQFYLRFLVHLVGDIHQPMHTGHAEDRGGNLIEVKFFGKPTNLHSLWDTELLESQNLSFSEFAAFINTQDKQLIKTYLTSSPADWLKESMALSESIYQSAAPAATNTLPEFSYGYIHQQLPVAEERLLQAGIRLAGLLNSIFDPRAKPGTAALAVKP